jgi:ABC-type dipeptide/oligopeptide/nickel transport system ATPase component
MSLLDVRKLRVDLPAAAGWIRPVNDVSFDIAPAQSLGLVGESGSGKTMLASRGILIRRGCWPLRHPLRSGN